MGMICGLSEFKIDKNLSSASHLNEPFCMCKGSVSQASSVLSLCEMEVGVWQEIYHNILWLRFRFHHHYCAPNICMQVKN